MSFQAMPFQSKAPYPKVLDSKASHRNLLAAKLNMVALYAVFAFIGAVVFGLI